MAHVWPGRVRETTTTAGSGPYTLGGAVTGYRTFAAALADGDTVDVCVRLGANYEIGRYTFSAGALARTAIFLSSNADAAVVWGSGTKDIFATYIPFSDLDATGIANIGLLVGTLGITGTPSAGQFGVFAGAGSIEGKTAAQMRTLLSLVAGTDVQAFSAKLAAIAALTWASGKLLGLTGTGTVAAIGLDTDTTLAANSDTSVATQKAVKAYIDALLGAQDAMVYKGVIDCSANPNYPAASAGHTYRVSVAGKIGGASGKTVEVGDIAICLTDATSSGNEASVGANWNVIQNNIDGALVGPAASITDGNPAVWDTTNRKLKELSWPNFRAAADLEPGVDFVAAQAGLSGVMPVGWSGFMNCTAASVANGATVTGASVRTVVAHGSGFTSGAGTQQTGTWRNVSGVPLGTGTSELFGQMERVN